MKITESRVTIVNEDGKIIDFPYTLGKIHQDCIDEYAKKKGYEYSNITHVVHKKNNVLFLYANEGMVVCYMPKQLTDEQLEILDILSLKMDDVNYMEVRKYLEEGVQDFILSKDIGKRFSDEVIQSYFIKKDKTM